MRTRSGGRPGGRGSRAGSATPGEAGGGPVGGPDADPGADPIELARGVCLDQLAVAPRTRAQLAEALRRRGVPAAAAETVLGRFAEVGLIDDEAFAAAWIRTRHAGRGLARRALARELRGRGVEPEVLDAALEELTPDQELATARRLVARKLAAGRGLPPRVRLRRLVQFLARKGYSPRLAFRVAQEALEAEGLDVGELDLDAMASDAESAEDELT